VLRQLSLTTSPVLVFLKIYAKMKMRVTQRRQLCPLPQGGRAVGHSMARPSIRLLLTPGSVMTMLRTMFYRLRHQ
jgi:hypothetical protein